MIKNEERGGRDFILTTEKFSKMSFNEEPCPGVGTSVDRVHTHSH